MHLSIDTIVQKLTAFGANRLRQTTISRWQKGVASYSILLPANDRLTEPHQISMDYFPGDPITYSKSSGTPDEPPSEFEADAIFKIKKGHRVANVDSYANVAQAYFNNGNFVYSRSSDTNTSFNRNCRTAAEFREQIVGYFGIPFDQFTTLIKFDKLDISYRGAVRELFELKI